MSKKASKTHLVEVHVWYFYYNIRLTQIGGCIKKNHPYFGEEGGKGLKVH